MMRRIHPLAGALALMTILGFWLSTALTGVFGTEAAVILVKTSIPWGFLLLLPALAAAGGSGAALSRGRRGGQADRKRKRMPLIAANGIMVLIPSALFLAHKAGAGELDGPFHAVQAVELVAGAANIVLLSLNMRDGLRMTGRSRQSPRRDSQARRDQGR